MSTFVPPILGFDTRDAEARAARAAGWRRGELMWERLQERGNACFDAGDGAGAARAWRRAWWLGLILFDRGDPRRATGLANLAHVDRLAGREARARRRFAAALRMWGGVDDFIAGMSIARRGRSSMFHLRMENRHWDTYCENLRRRMRAFAAESAGALHALANGEPVQCRLSRRWRGEKPAVFDDTRRFLAAALLIGGGAQQPPAARGQDGATWPAGAARMQDHS
ncbi:MAG: hypothetical protein Kow0058_00240 [Roseovarius sp.]